MEEEKEAHFLLGRSRVNAMDYRGAIEAFQEALEVNPRSGAAHLELGVLYAEKESNPAAAIYHYEEYLRLRPDAGNAEMLKQHIFRLKQELAQTVLPVAPAAETQRQMEQLAEENRRLREELERYKNYVGARGLPSNQPPSALAANVRSNVTTRVSSTATRSQQVSQSFQSTRSATGVSGRVHKVQSGETPSAIARRYNLKLESFMAANPGLNPRRMRVGQTVSIPGL